MDHHSDEKWKFSKRGGSRSRREPPTSSSASTSSSAGASSSSSSSSSSSLATTSGPYLKRSSSMPENVKLTRRPPIAGSPPSSPRSFSRKCANMAKEQRAKFYIVRRCVTMLMCWRDYP